MQCICINERMRKSSSYKRNVSSDFTIKQQENEPSEKRYWKLVLYKIMSWIKSVCNRCIASQDSYLPMKKIEL